MSDQAFSEVHARFYVAEATMTAYGPKGSGKIKLQAVSRGDQNKQWAEATPGGTIEMAINNPVAFAWFADQIGGDVAVVFTPAAIFQPADGHPYRESEAPPGTSYGPPYCGDCARPEGEHTAQG
jgi:hypothetical protein